MQKPITLEELENNLSFIKKMYDAVRLVDPVRKIVLEQRGDCMSETTEICHNYWRTDNICDNCISIQAYRENECFVKLEQTPSSIMMVMAIPITGSDQPVVLELLKNITNSILIGQGDYNDGVSMHKLVAELNTFATKDVLTNLFNRRYADDRLPVDIIKATIKQWPLSVIFVDMDNLKFINDAFGHAVGDRALISIADIIRSCIRSDVDWAARYGGDELLICLNNTPNNLAYAIAERIRCKIENEFFPTPTGKVGITVSIGLHTIQGSHLTADELIQLADKNMYEAKKEGKNRIIGRKEGAVT